MMPPKVTLEAAAVRREWVFSLLTLDVVRAFYDLMGFNADAQARLQRVLRDTTLTARKELVDALVKKAPQPTMATFCRQVEASLGSATTDHLAWWLEYVFDTEAQTHTPLDRWTHVLRHCHREGDESWRRLPFPPQLSAEVARRLVAALDNKELKKRIEVIEERPLSDWDLHMYASQTYDFSSDVEGAWPNPLDNVAATVHAYQRYEFWAWLLRALTPEQQSKLHDKALEIVRIDELTWIKDLVPPSSLDIGL